MPHDADNKGREKHILPSILCVVFHVASSQELHARDTESIVTYFFFSYCFFLDYSIITFVASSTTNPGNTELKMKVTVNLYDSSLVALIWSLLRWRYSTLSYRSDKNCCLCINRHPNLNSRDRPVCVRNIERHTNINELPCTFLSLTLLHIDIKSFNCCIDQSTNLIPGIYI